MVQRSRYVNHANRDYNQFLNINSIPNISSFYVNNPNVQNPNMVQPQVQQLQQNPYNIPRPMINNYIVSDNDRMNKQIEYPKKIVRMDDDSVVEKKPRIKKNKEEDIEKKSSSNVLFYITIILLCVVIIILLMKSMKR
jgi:hypothetical protein